MLSIENVSKSYKKRKVVDGVSFSVSEGELVGLIGPNGAGKSTLLSMVATLAKPDSGRILFRGEDITTHPKAIRAKLGFVPQEIALYDTLSGRDNMRFWGKSYGVHRDLESRIEEVCSFINFDAELLKKRVSEYSGGMKRRLNIGVALLHNPELLIFDEPTTGIDVESGRMILETIKGLRMQGKAVIYVGHYLEEIEELATHICVMNAGRVRAFGPKEELLAGRTMEQLYRLE